MMILKTSVFALILLLYSHSVLAVNIGIFGDTRFEISDIDQGSGNFTIGDLDFYATEEIADNTRGFIELVFENTSSGIVVDLERLWIMRTITDEFKVAAGRFHTPLGRWNRTYHHGALIQDTVSRPFFLNFEDDKSGILHLHTIGLFFTGEFLRDSDEITYEISYGNGPSLNTSAGFNPPANPGINIRGNSDSNSKKSIAARLSYNHDDLPFIIGMSAMTHEITELAASGGLQNLDSTLVQQNIFALDFIFSKGKHSLTSEFYYFSTKNNVGSIGTFPAYAWYLEYSYKVLDDFKVILREESLRFDASNDSFFKILGTEQAKHHVLAFRYDLDETNAIKIELNAADFDQSKDSTSLIVQWAFLIP